MLVIEKIISMKKYLIVLAGIFMLSSCVAKRYLTQSQETVASLREDSAHLANRITDLQNNITELQNHISTSEGRAKNRRTDIILSPKLEEMYKLLDMQ